MFMRVAFAVVMLLAALAPSAAVDRLAITGKVFYREKLLLPAGTTLSVSLLDLDRNGKVLVSVDAVTADRGRSPLDFSLNVAPNLLRADGHYGLSAEIVTSGQRLWFKSEAPVPVDPAALELPVELLVAAAGQKPLEETEISRFFDRDMEVVELSGAALVDDRYPTLRFSADLRASGQSGCNSWFAQATLDGDAISFSPAAATRMACLGDGLGAQESAFFAALEKAAHWEVKGALVYLRDAEGADVMTLALLPKV